MHAVRNLLRAAGLFPKQGPSRLSQRSSRRGGWGPGGTAGAPGHASWQPEGAVPTAPLYLRMRRAAQDVGLTVVVRRVSFLVVFAVDDRRVHEGTRGSAEGWSWVRGSGGQNAALPEVRWSDACALSAGRVQTECGGAMEGLGWCPLEQCWLGCRFCGVGTLLASDGATSIEDVSAATLLGRSRMDFASRSAACSCKRPPVAGQWLKKR
jgi:hypothetical protein